MDKLRERIAAAMDDARRLHDESKSDFDAGIYEGLKLALRLLEKEEAH